MGANPVIIRITTKKLAKKWLLVPYGHTLGTWASPIYWVPLYEMKVDGVSRGFQVIRFGLQRKDNLPIEKSRRCDAYIFTPRPKQVPRWKPKYKPHSFDTSERGASAQGAVVIKGAYYVHAGPSKRETAAGSLGCVEVCGKNEWTRFLSSLKSVGGVNGISKLVSSGRLFVESQPAAVPYAEAVVKDFSVRKAFGQALNRAVKRGGGQELTEPDIVEIIRSTKTGRKKKWRKVSPQEVRDLKHINKYYTIDKKGQKLLDDFLFRHSIRLPERLH